MGLEDKIGKGAFFFIGVIVVALFFIWFVRQDSGLERNPLDFGIKADNSTGSFGIGFDANVLGLFSNDAGFLSAVSAKRVDAFFCPQDNCADKLIERIDSAQNSLFIAIYSFTHDGIADAVVRAEQRGVEVMVVFDNDQSLNEASDDEKLVQAGVKVARRNGSGYMHNKFAVIDGNVVATGSFNYSMNADTRNEENLVFIESGEIADKFKADFDLIWDKSIEAS
jgi:phosphatidylserine/phosphatidylglycerophosphate/cardiolipin synthase-like enzyme